MKSKYPILLALVASASGVHAATVVTASQTNGTNSLPHTYMPSSTDLLTGLTPTTSMGNFTQEGAGGAGVLNNGSFTSPITRDGGGPFPFGTFATGGNAGGTQLIYTLTTPANIGIIDVYGGWQDGGRDQQSYSIFFSTSLAPLTFNLLQTVDFNPAGTGFPQVTRVTISDPSGTLATDVAALRFDFNATENGYAGYAEIDVFAVPEPSSLTLLGLSAVALLRRRRC